MTIRPRDSSVDELCDEIVARYHVSLHGALPRIRGELSALAAHGASAALQVMLAAFSELADRIEANLAKEENLLFPALEALSDADREGRPRPALPFATVLHPIRVMEDEHVRIEQALERLHELALAVTEPDTLSASWRQCMADLSALDTELRDHHRTENEILFPRALELERRVI
jgi:regulator of cell morphogenesis and NO signaling